MSVSLVLSRFRLRGCFVLIAITWLAQGSQAWGSSAQQRSAKRIPVQVQDYDKNRDAYRPYVISISEKYDVSPVLTEAVIHVESFFDPQATSHAGAIGLMQLMRPTARRYGVYNRRNPIKNIEAGVQYLRDLMQMFDNDLELVLAAYNAGEGAVMRYGNRIPPYAETKDYVRKVRSKMVQIKNSVLVTSL